MSPSKQPHLHFPEASMVTAEKKLPSINQVLQHLALFRMFLPLVIVSVLAIGVIGYFSEQTLEKQQHQKAKYIAHMIDYRLDEAVRALDAVAHVTDGSSTDNILFLQDAWKTFRHFDTIYHLDAGSKIKLLVPYDPRYLGLDLSNLSLLRQSGGNAMQNISIPFMSLRTGNPTIYLLQQVAAGERLVGELNLGSLQEEIIHPKGLQDKSSILILDQYGMLLAHPSSALVKQQSNQGSLPIFRRALHGDVTSIYDYAGTMVLGSATRVEGTGWVVVNQIPLSVAFDPYLWAFGLTLLASMAHMVHPDLESPSTTATPHRDSFGPT